jgi:hypothetical protein
MYGGATGNAAETLAASVAGDSLGPFAGPVGLNTIAGLGGGTLIGPVGVSWQDVDGSYHGIVMGGIDLVTRLRRDGAWDSSTQGSEPPGAQGRVELHPPV